MTFNQEVIQTVLTIIFQIVFVPEILLKHTYLITILFKYNVTLCNFKLELNGGQPTWEYEIALSLRGLCEGRGESPEGNGSFGH